MSKYLLTGGCGFLGSNIAAHLIRSKEEVIVFDNLHRRGASQNLAWLRTLGDFDFVHGDIRSAYDVEGVVSTYKPDVIFHLAGQVAMTTSLQNPRLDFEVNAVGTLNILEAVRRHLPNAIVVYSSTNKVYGDLDNLRCTETATRYVLDDYPLGIPEEMLLDFHSPYGCSKGAADQYVLDYHRMFKIKTVVFRHSSMYGGRQFSTYDQGWIGWFCAQALKQKNGKQAYFTVSGSGKQVRDVLHVDDMVRLYLKAVLRIKNCNGFAFNIGGGMANSLSIMELLQFLEDELKVSLHVKHIAVRESDQKVFVANLAKVTSLLDWSPAVDWMTGLRRMLKWVEEHEGPS